jgi:hypothetical protein
MRKIQKEIKLMKQVIEAEKMNLENDTAKEEDSERDE